MSLFYLPVIIGIDGPDIHTRKSKPERGTFAGPVRLGPYPATVCPDDAFYDCKADDGDLCSPARFLEEVEDAIEIPGFDAYTVFQHKVDRCSGRYRFCGLSKAIRIRIWGNKSRGSRAIINYSIDLATISGYTAIPTIYHQDHVPGFILRGVGGIPGESIVPGFINAPGSAAGCLAAATRSPDGPCGSLRCQ
jgi:hypothetical protein